MVLNPLCTGMEAFMILQIFCAILSFLSLDFKEIT